jgi:hypothetical protein
VEAHARGGQRGARARRHARLRLRGGLPARAALTRTRAARAQANAELAAAWQLLQALWNRDYPVRPAAARTAHSLALAQPRRGLTRASSPAAPRAPPRTQGVGAALASPAWGAAAAPLVAAIGARHRERTLRLLSTAYTSISLADTAVYLALSEPDAAAGAGARGGAGCA